MKELLIGILIVSLAIWWAVKNPHTAEKVVNELEDVATKVVKTVSD